MVLVYFGFLKGFAFVTLCCLHCSHGATAQRFLRLLPSCSPSEMQTNVPVQKERLSSWCSQMQGVWQSRAWTGGLLLPTNDCARATSLSKRETILCSWSHRDPLHRQPWPALQSLRVHHCLSQSLVAKVKASQQILVMQFLHKPR